MRVREIILAVTAYSYPIMCDKRMDSERLTSYKYKYMVHYDVISLLRRYKTP